MVKHNCFSLFVHFVGLALGLIKIIKSTKRPMVALYQSLKTLKNFFVN